jgi:hypothetical protein
MAFSVTELVAAGSLIVSISAAIWAKFKLILDLKKELENKIDKLASEVKEEVKEIGSCINRYQLAFKDQCNGHMQFVASQMATQDVRLSKQEMKMELFWKMIEKEVSGMLHQPTHHGKDELLEKWPNLSLDEIKQLKDILVKEREEMYNQVSSLDEKKKAYLLGLALRLAHIEYILIDHNFVIFPHYNNN